MLSNAAAIACAVLSRRWRTDVRGFLSSARRSRSTAQIIDDGKGQTIASASTIEQDLKGNLKTGADTAAAAAVGKLVAERALAAGVKQVVFDRGGYMYHGRIKALADAARECGLEF